MESILSLARKHADEVEVFRSSVEQTPVVFEANRLKQLHTRQSMVTTLRLVRNGKIGLATAAGPCDAGKLVNRALELSELGISSRLDLPSQKEYPEVKVYHPEVESTTVEDMVALGESLINGVRRHTPELLCQVEVTKEVISVQVLNSRGGDASYRKSVFAIGMEGTLVRGTDMLFVFGSEASCHPIRDIDKLSQSIIRQLEWARNNASVSTRRLPVIFTPLGVASVFTAPLMAAFNGKTVLQGASPLGDKLGKRIFDERLSLYDDATLDYRPGGYPCDDEGVMGQRTPLIEGGVVTNFLYDLQTAGQAGVSSTGNGGRGSSGMPTPSVSNLVVATGDVSFEDMIRDMREGLVIEHLMGAEQGNVLGGDFSGNILLGYKVENGEVVGRVKDVMLSGNIYRILERLIALGSKPEWVSGSLQTPALYCSNLAVASKK